MGNISKWKDLVWNKDSNSFEEMKIDDYGRWMKYSEFGNMGNDYGWHLDHIMSRQDGGGDDPSNLRPLNWRSNIGRNHKNVRSREIG